jgi:hypothetical protein
MFLGARFLGASDGAAAAAWRGSSRAIAAQPFGKIVLTVSVPN